jgi:hypothetical protein
MSQPFDDPDCSFFLVRVPPSSLFDG